MNGAWVEALTCRYRYRLRVSPSQAAALDAVFEADREVWNTALGRWNDLWRHEGIHYFYGDMAAELTDWRQTYDWLGAQPSSPQQQTLRDLSAAISSFLDTRSSIGRPRPRTRRAPTKSARWDAGSFSVRAGRLHLPVAGGRTALRVVWSRPLPPAVQSVTVLKDATGRWWASFVVRLLVGEVAPSRETTGLDLGLTTFATTEYADADVPNPRYGRAAAKALARSQRSHARKQKGSKGRERARLRTARLYTQVANQRRDFHQKEARKLARRFERIGVEDLRIDNMRRKGKGRRKAGLNRSISDAGWGDFRRALEWQAKKCGHEVVRLPARNTTQTCSGCGVKANRRLGLADRTFECSECGLVLDRDRNAARNLNPGWAVPGAPVDGSKTMVLVRTVAARGTESVSCVTPSSQEPPTPFRIELTTSEVARLAGVTSATIHHHVMAGHLRSQRFGRQWVFTRADVDAWLAEPRKRGRRARPPRVASTPPSMLIVLMVSPRAKVVHVVADTLRSDGTTKALCGWVGYPSTVTTYTSAEEHGHRPLCKSCLTRR